MKTAYEVLGQKEIEVRRVRKEVEALRLAIELISGDDDNSDSATSVLTHSPRIVQSGGH
jgi:hypothetical protein